nr:meiosis 1 arrest protein isoform X1 [Crassostrea gigas]
MKTSTYSRPLLGKQPARILLVDSESFPSDPDMVDCLTEAISNFFSVACNLGGPSRMSLFGIMTFSSYPEILLPLSHVKSNYGRIQSAVKDLQSALKSRNSAAETEASVTRAIEEACRQYQRYMSFNSLQVRGVLQQVEIVLMTLRQTKKMQQQIEEALESSDLTNLKRVQLVEVDSWTKDLMETIPSLSQSSGLSSNSSSPTSGLLDVVRLDGDGLSLQNFFNAWLLNTDTDTEHLHLVLPEDSFSDNGNFIIRCDLQERVLNPAHLPFYEQFTVHSESASMKTFPTPSKAAGMWIPIHRIIITDTIPVQNICESVIFGVPMIVQATSCWKLEWEELEKNQQRFKALCYLLMEKEMALIGHIKSPDPSLDGGNTKASKTLLPGKASEEKPCGWYVFLPAPNGTLLVKGIAAKELLLPYTGTTVMDDISDEALDSMRESFEKLEVLDNFNPLQRPSELYRCLKAKYGHDEDKHSKHKSSQSIDMCSSPKQPCPGASLKIDHTGRRHPTGRGGTHRRMSPLPVKVGRLRSLVEFPQEL